MKKRSLISILLPLSLNSCDDLNLVTEVKTSTYIANFPDDKSAAVSFTFDDNCASSFTSIAPIFEQNGLRATFFIIPGSIRSDEWSKWKTLTDKGFEIGNHSMSHLNLTRLDTASLHEQVNESFEVIKRNVNRTPLSFATPGHSTNGFVNDIISEKHLFNRTNPENFIWQGWTSSTTQKDVIEHITESVRKKTWYVVAAHGVDDCWEPISESILRNTIEFCKKNEDKIVVETFQNISLYRKELESSILSIKKGTDRETIKIDSGLPSDIYNFPLTLVIKDYQFPSPYRIYNKETGESVEYKAENGKLLIQVYINNTYEIRWREW
ncbi:MAG: polysaccharide deacetylase family protein [Chryseosolibacter sp.]